MRAPTTSPDYRSIFERQRRNLVGASVFLIFVRISGAKVENLAIFASAIDGVAADIIQYGLMMAIAYWLWRYQHYLYRLEDYRAAADIDKAVGAIFQRRAFKDVRKKYEDHLNNFIGESEARRPCVPSARNLNARMTGSGYIVRGEFDIGTQDTHDNSFFRLDTVGEEFAYSRWYVLGYRFLASISQMRSNYKMSEYLFPLLLPYVLLLIILVQN